MAALKIEDLYKYLQNVETDDNMYSKLQYIITIPGYNPYDRHIRINTKRNNIWVYIDGRKFAALNFSPENRKAYVVTDELCIKEVSFATNIQSIPFEPLWDKFGNRSECVTRQMLYDAVENWYDTRKENIQ